MRVRQLPRLTAAVIAGCLVGALSGCLADTGEGPKPAESRAAGPATGTTAPEPTATASPTGSPTVSPTSRPTRSAAGRPTVAGTVVTGLAAPWGLAFLPDGSALVSQRDDGTIVRVAGGRVSEVGAVPGVQAEGEGGLLGIAVSPAFAEDRLVYAYLTAAEDNRVVRMRYDGKRLGEPDVVLDGIAKNVFHNGGRIAFGPDGMLYVATGDAGDPDLSQDRESISGKILRVTPEGEPAPGNPFGNSPVWSWGHRNVQGLAWDDEGRLWASEFGQNTYDELNVIEKGRNYGWPLVEGRGNDERFTNPRVVWSPEQASPSGVAVAGGAVYVAGLRGARLWQVPLGDGKPRDYFAGKYGRLRTVAAAPDGSLWLVTSNTDGRGDVRDGDDRIVRLELE